MANSFVLAQKYIPMLDQVYKKGSISGVLDTPADRVKFTGAKTVNVFMVEVDGLADYDRNNGFVRGSAKNTWQPLEITQDRGREIPIDIMDQDETLDMAVGATMGEFMRTKVIPEIDAYRFSKYASTTGIQSKSANITTSANAWEAFDVASAALDDAEVPDEGRIAFVTPSYYNLLKTDNSANKTARMSGDTMNRNFTMIDQTRVVKVPQNRFYSAIDLYDGTTEGEEGGFYKKASSAVNLNFMILHTSAVIQVVKHQKPRLFSPEEYQDMQAYKFDYRVYHDAWVYKNKATGIYVHKAAT